MIQFIREHDNKKNDGAFMETRKKIGIREDVMNFKLMRWENL